MMISPEQYAEPFLTFRLRKRQRFQEKARPISATKKDQLNETVH